MTRRIWLPDSAVLFDCRVTHARRAPVRNIFSYRTCLWLVDADDMPRLGPLASFRPADHAGDRRLSVADNVRRLAAEHGIDLDGGQIRMLTSPRVAGLVFNPLTVYWCRTAQGAPACVIAEVHNTYRQRHRYLVRTDERGRAEMAKAFYVSPFYPVTGHYRLSLPEPGERLRLSVTYQPPGGPEFAAAVNGQGRPATWSQVARMSARYPVPGAVTAARIRGQGLGLYARGLRTLPRPPHAPQEGT